MKGRLVIVAVAATASAALFGFKRVDEAPVTLAFVGDILLDSAPGRTIAQGGDPFAKAAALFEHADLRIGNLECPVAESGEVVEKNYTFRASPSTLPTLRAHFNAVSVANNHSGDYGPLAFQETLRHLKDARVPFFGGGDDLRQAHEPLILERRGLKIALLGYDDYHPRSFEASPERAGVAWAEDEQVILDMKRARALGADVVLPFFHWGWENETEPCARQRELARKLIDAGADAVIGSHPHITQGAEMYRGRPIVYSLGNFVFDLMDQPENRIGWVLTLQVDHAGVARFSTAAVHIDQTGTPHPDPSVATPCGVRGAASVEPCVR